MINSKLYSVGVPFKFPWQWHVSKPNMASLKIMFLMDEIGPKDT